MLQAPSPWLCQHSCVYVLQDRLGWLYCGETDDIGARLRRHRQQGPTAAVVLALQSGQGKSLARMLEANVIEQLVKDGLRVCSTHDQLHRHFGSAGAAVR